MKHVSNQQNILIGEYRFIPPPPTGYFKVLAKACNCDERTVRYALRGNTFSQKAETIRREYYNRYVKPYI